MSNNMRETRGGRMSFTSYAEHMAFLDGLMADGYKLNGTDRKPNPSPDSRFFGISWGVLADGKCFQITERPEVYGEFNRMGLVYKDTREWVELKHWK